MISILIPVVRLQNIPTLLERIKATHGLPEEPEILWEEDTEHIGCPKMVKKLTDRAKYDLVCFLGDDTDPQQDFLKLAHSILVRDDLWLVGFNDTISRKPTHWLASKKLLNEKGEFFSTDFFHNYVDDELRVRAERHGKYGWSPESIVKHNHPAYGTAPKDEFYERADKGWSHDQELFASRCCKLSVAMIVKDESAVLERCLESIKDADEIVIVDTGSTDNTKDIAFKYTDKIFDFPWCDDFAKARNEALSHCTNDWVLSIDADEIMEAGGIEKLRKHLFTYKDAIGIKMTCGLTEYHVPRCFRRTPLIKWTGVIHETVNSSDYDKTDVTMQFTSSPAHQNDPDRNIRMLEKAAKDDPENTRYMYYLAREYCYRQKYSEAIEWFKKHLSRVSWLPERADANFMLALAYWYNGKGDDARKTCAESLIVNSNFKAACLLMADMSWEHNKNPWLKMAESATNEGLLFYRKNHLVF